MTPKVTPISSRDNPLVVRARKLANDAAYARREKLCWLEGEHLCRAALARQIVPVQAFVTEQAWATPLGQVIASAAPSVAVVPASLFASMASLESPASVAFWIGVPPAPAMQAKMATIILDRVQDPGNVGTILRSASAFGFHQIVALKGTAGLWSAKVLRAAMGAHFGLRLIEHVEAADLEMLKVPLLGTSVSAGEVLGTQPLPNPCAWLIGHEGQGVDPALLARCERIVRIAQPGGEESLNAGVAASICMHASVQPRT